MIKLYWESSNKITLENSIKNCYKHLENAVGLIYSPQRCYFVKFHDGKIEQPPEEKEIDIKSIFEARLFKEHAELRWLNKLNGEGKAVLISENELDLCLAEQPEPLEIIAIEKQKYLLWGESTGNSLVNGWSKLSSSRIGSIYVPQITKNKQRVYLKTCEYLQSDECYGNVSVVEERLIGLE